ncbi:unnamed protein product [Trypanosoma congolense IL3000]|uniref:WGS project CAEQ00000000 data, annotated contig 1639 n=1 Tax=Trypanosoma congolense (strain IL3000) TaxID=1068625 RepID=F9W7Q0_TRYCI|nr:unnamed protein product [Trypanosoma congolense IL3000]
MSRASSSTKRSRDGDRMESALVPSTPRPPAQHVDPTDSKSTARVMGEELGGYRRLYSMGQAVRVKHAAQLEAGTNDKRLTQLCVEYPDATEIIRTSDDGLPGRFLRLARDAPSMPLEMPDIPIGTTISQPGQPPRTIWDHDSRREIATKELEARMTNRRILHLHNNRERLRKFECIDTNIEFTQAMQVALRTFAGTLYVLEKFGPAITIEGMIKANGGSWHSHQKWLGRIDEEGNQIEPGKARGRYDHYRVAYQAACYWADHHERTIYALAGPLAKDVQTFSRHDYDEMMSAFVTFHIAIIAKVYAGRKINVTAIRQHYAEGIDDDIQQSIDEHISQYVERQYKRVAYNRRPLVPTLTRTASRTTFLGSGGRHRPLSLESRKGKSRKSRKSRNSRVNPYTSDAGNTPRSRTPSSTQSRQKKGRQHSNAKNQGKSRVRFTGAPPE